MPFRKNSFLDIPRITVITIFISILIALVVLTGWIFDLESLKSFFPNWPSIKVNTAIGSIISGISLLLFIRKKKIPAFFLAIIVFLIGAVTLSEYLFHFDAQIDELLFLDKGTSLYQHHGRMAQMTSVAFILIGISLLTYSIKAKWAQKLSESCTILLLVMSFTGFIGVMYNAGRHFRVTNFASFSLPTAISGLLVSIGILFSKPDTGFFKVFYERTVVAKAAIKGISITIGMLLVIGWLCLKGEDIGIFTHEMDLVIMTITFSISFIIVTRLGIRRLNESEDRLKASEKNLRHVLASTADIFYVVDKNYRITLINETAEKVLNKAWGKPLKLGDNILDFIPDEKDEPIRKSFERVFAGERIEYELHQSGGGLAEWYLVNYMPVSDEKGGIIGAYVVTKDITGRKKTEEELQKSEERYRSLIEQASDYIMITDAQGNFIDVNSSLCNTFGYAREELLGKNIATIIDPIQFKNDPIRFDLLLEGRSMLRERRMMNKDGTIIEVEANVKMLPDGRILAIARDMTERKKVEAILRKSEERFRIMVDNATEVLVVLDAEKGKFVEVSESAVSLYKWTKKELINVGPLEVSPVFQPDGRRSAESAAGYINEAINGGKPSFEWTHCDKDGNLIPCEIRLVRLPSENQVLIRGSIIDITERKSAENQIKQSYEQIRRLTEHLQNIREEERAHIAREIHDELGQQLTVLKMDASWLINELSASDDTVKEKIKDLLELLDSTVNTVRRISSELRPSLLDDMGLVPAMEWHLKEFGKRMNLKTKLTVSEQEPLFTDSIKTGLFRIFQESLTNVARHANAKKVEVDLKEEDGQIVLSIKDDGLGFEKEKAAGKKTLGILGMKERSFMMGGSYQINSIPGEGVLVVVSVPYEKSISR